MRTSPFKNVSQYYAIDSYRMLTHTSDTRRIIKYAFSVLEKLYRAGYEYKKAGVKLSCIRDKNQTQLSIFEKPDSLDTGHLMQAMDAINNRDGFGTLQSAACGVSHKAWAMNRNFKSDRFVTGWSELKKVTC